VAERSVRWVRLFWPELVFGAGWLLLLVLGHTVYTDDEMWQHAAIDAMQWVVFVGYVLAAAASHLKPTGDAATD
jgi:hypothetical protein